MRRAIRVGIVHAPNHLCFEPHPEWHIWARSDRFLRQGEECRGLRVIHILYTVWGHHTTSSVNGQ
jgi:hypothetical protein